MPEVNRAVRFPKGGKAQISEIRDGIYRISGFVTEYGISFNQFLIDDEQPTLIHTGPVGMYEQVEQKVKEVIPLERLTNVAFLHFESDEWGGMEILKAPRARLLCSDLSSKLNLMGWHGVPADHISFWEDETLKTGKRTFRFIMTPHVHHWDSMMMFEETTKSLFTSDLFIQPGDNKPVSSEDMSEAMIGLYKGIGIFASEQPVRQTVKRLARLNPEMVYPMHGSCFEGSLFATYSDALLKKDFAYSGMLLGQKLEIG
ncbi:MAG TPA: FprA family A-type flavoprotein [Nitrososphaera sp.]|nr:FprA family A-type flavoprotein [Nitrososphaera sp.]